MDPSEPDRPHVAVITANPVRVGGMQTFTRFVVDGMRAAGWRVTIALSGRDIYRHAASGVSGRPTVEPVEWVDPTLKGDRRYRWSAIRDRRRD